MIERNASSQSQPAGPADVLPRLEPDPDSRRRLHAAVLLAAALHLWVFAITWPRLAATTTSDEPVDVVHVLKLQNIRFKRPKPPEEIRLPPKILHMPGVENQPPHVVERTPPPPPLDLDSQLLPPVDVPPPPPAALPEAPRIVDVSRIEAPRVLERVQPAYTRAAIAARLEGAVILELVIGEEGGVESVRVLRGLPLGLTESAMDAVRRWRFEPSTLEGRPIKVRYRLTVHFQLR